MNHSRHPRQVEGESRESQFLVRQALSKVREERSRAEALARALQSERDMLSAIMENTRTHLAYLDCDFRFVKANSAYAAGTGFRIDELLGRNHFDLFPSEENRAIFERARDTGEAVEYRARPFTYPDQPERGTTYWDWTLAPVTNAEGAVQGLVLSLTDVTQQERAREALRTARDDLQLRVAEATAGLRAAVHSLENEVAERKRIELALRESEARLRILVEQVPAILWTTDRDLRYTSLEGAGLSSLGREPGALVGQLVTSSDQGNDEEIDRVLEAHRRALAGESVEYRNQWADVLFEGYVEPLRDAGGAIIGCIGAGVDISERLRSEQARREQEEQYRAIFESTTDGIVIVAMDGTIVDANPAACSMSGFSYDELLHLDPAEFFRPNERESVIHYFRLARSGERMKHQTVAVSKEGVPFDIEIRAGRFMYGGQPHILGVIRDVTENVRTYQLLEQRVNERTHELSSLLQFSREISGTLQMRPRLELVVNWVSRLIDNTAAALFLLEDDQLVLASQCSPWSTALTEPVVRTLNQPALRSQLMAQSGVLVIPDVNSSKPGAAIARAAIGSIPEQAGALRSILWVPLVVNEKVIGGLGIAHAAPNHYSERDASLVQAIANQASVAIENARLYEQAHELAVMHERQRLARDLHDSVTQSLYSLMLMAEAARRQIDAGDTGRGMAYLTRIASTSQQVLKEMRLLVYELRPLMLERDGLVSALKQRLEAVEARAGVATNLVVEGRPILHDRIESELYRIAQEALNNSLKHSGATSVEVTLCSEGHQVTLEVRDNGRGFARETATGQGGLGLIGLQERAQRLGGRVDIVAQPEQGVVVRVTVPTSDSHWD